MFARYTVFDQYRFAHNTVFAPTRRKVCSVHSVRSVQCSLQGGRFPQYTVFTPRQKAAFGQYFSMSFSTSVACHVEHVIGLWKSSPAKRPGITSHYCARMQNSGDDYRSSRIFNSCPGPEGLSRSNNYIRMFFKQFQFGLSWYYFM